MVLDEISRADIIIDDVLHAVSPHFSLYFFFQTVGGGQYRRISRQALPNGCEAGTSEIFFGR